MINRKKYKKIVGSCIVMSFMMFALLFYVKDTEATDKEIVYAPGYYYTKSEYVVNGESIAPQAPSEKSGYLFAGWYTFSEGSYTPVADPQDETTYYAKFVPQEILGMKAQVTTALIKDEATSKTANSAIRFITTVDSDLYKEVGFNIDRPGKSTPYDTGNGVVYKELYAVDATRENKGEPDTTYTPDMFHKQSEYFKTWTIGKIPETYYDSDITVRPYWITLDGTRVDGETAVKTVNYGRSWYYVDADAEPENTAAPKGTASNPYETLAEAVAVETTLNPKIILKSDVTIDETVNIARTMTVESYIEAKTITHNDATTNMMEVTENGNLTLNKLNLNGGNYVVNSTNATVTANDVNIQEGGEYGFRMVSGTANLNNVEITGVDCGVQLESSATVTINGTLTTTGGSYGIDINAGNLAAETATINVTNTTCGLRACGGVTSIGELNISDVSDRGLIVDEDGRAIISKLNITTTGGRGVDVLSGGNLTIETSGTIDNVPTSYGVCVDGTATLNNVTVSNVANNAAIKVFENGNLTADTLTMITGNKRGLEIDGKAASNNAEVQANITGLNVQNTIDRGIYVIANGTATINTLTVANTTGRGVDVEAGGTLTVNGGTIHDIPSSFGVYVAGKVTLNDVAIQSITKNYTIRVAANGELYSDGLTLSGINSGGINVEGSADTKNAKATLNNLTLDATFTTGHGVRAKNAEVTITTITKTANTTYASGCYDLTRVSNATFTVSGADTTITKNSDNISITYKE